VVTFADGARNSTIAMDVVQYQKLKHRHSHGVHWVHVHPQGEKKNLGLNLEW